MILLLNIKFPLKRYHWLNWLLFWNERTGYFNKKMIVFHHLLYFLIEMSHNSCLLAPINFLKMHFIPHVRSILMVFKKTTWDKMVDSYVQNVMQLLYYLDNQTMWDSSLCKEWFLLCIRYTEEITPYKVMNLSCKVTSARELQKSNSQSTLDNLQGTHMQLLSNHWATRERLAC